MTNRQEPPPPVSQHLEHLPQLVVVLRREAELQEQRGEGVLPELPVPVGLRALQDLPGVLHGEGVKPAKRAECTTAPGIIG